MNKFILSSTILNIKRSGWRAYAVIFMMTVTYMILGVLLTVMFTSQSIAQYFIQKPEIIGFLGDTIPEQEILEIKQTIETFGEVAEVKYISKEEAMASFLEDNKDNKDVIEAVTVNVFPAHLNVRVKDLKSVSIIADYFKSNDKFTDVLASEDVLETLNKIVMTIQVIGLSLLIVFSVSTVLIILLSIGITVFSQKNEIIVMKLVGASDKFVRTPYILQSIIYTLIAVFITLLLLVPLLLLKYDSLLRTLVGDLSIRSLSYYDLFIGACVMLAFGIFLSYFTSYFATRRYIKY
jgi:cell division transport system permease protein